MKKIEIPQLNKYTATVKILLILDYFTKILKSLSSKNYLCYIQNSKIVKVAAYLGLITKLLLFIP